MRPEDAKRIEHRNSGMRFDNGKCFLEVWPDDDEPDPVFSPAKILAEVFLVKHRGSKLGYSVKVALDGYATYPDLADLIAGLVTMTINSDTYLREYVEKEVATI